MIYSLKGRNIRKQFQQIAQSKGSQACWNVVTSTALKTCVHKTVPAMTLVCSVCFQWPYPAASVKVSSLNMTKPDTVTCYKPASTMVHKLSE